MVHHGGVTAPDPVAGTASLDRRLLDAIERLSHGLRALSQRTARAAGLTPLQQQALLAVARQPPQRREVGALAAEFDVTNPTMSDAITALVRKGLLTRSVADDARRRVLGLTDAGEQAAAELTGWDDAVLLALQGLDEGSKGAALDVLLSVIAALVRNGTITVARTCTTCRHFRSHEHSDALTPHHCALLDLPLRRTELRTDCPEHELVSA
jgi:DNA-binding MarR family transcriptional regulator